jgi:hypothetical protein
MDEAMKAARRGPKSVKTALFTTISLTPLTCRDARANGQP